MVGLNEKLRIIPCGVHKKNWGNGRLGQSYNYGSWFRERGRAMPIVAPVAEWGSLFARIKSEAPEAFDSEERILNLIEGEWKDPGFGRHYESPIDGRSLGRIPMIELETARTAVKFAKAETAGWAQTDLDERRRRVTDCLAGLKKQKELIALLLMWEIGKPYAQALTDIDRCISGVEWYVDNIEGMLGKRAPLGLISNIASWN